MRLYGKKNIRRLVDRRAKNRQEMRDGIIWQVEENTCRVKLQGSDTMVIAHFPRNQKELPLWLRRGNAVKIVHRDGIRGYIEVIGEGRTVPTPTSGGTFPDVGGLADCIISGLVITATSPASLSVKISAGTYRIDSVIYEMEEVTGGYIIMNDPAPMTMGVIPYVMAGQVYYELGAAPASGYFRYDILVIGTDSDVDLIEGVAATSDPAMPDTPVDHVLIGHVLRIGGESTVTSERIYETYEAPYPMELVIPSGLSLAWSVVIDNPEINFLVSIKDQFGDYISSASGWVLRLTKLAGTGDIWSADSGYHASEVQQDLVSLYQYTFKYRRDQTQSPEISPYLQVVLEEANSPVYGFERIQLLDSNGDPI